MDLQAQLYNYLKSGQGKRFNFKKQSTKSRSTALSPEEAHNLSLPPYALLRKPQILPPGTWALHCTRDSFRKFRRGSRLKNLHLSTFVPPTAAPLDNLRLPLEEAVFSFAYDPYDFDSLVNCTRYGLDAYLFQTDQAIKIYHLGDEEPQIIFPTRSEYDLHRIAPGSGSDASVKINGEWQQFDNLSDLIAALS